MSNVLSEEKKQQVIALGKLGWPLRRIEQATGVRRETASAYLKAGRRCYTAAAFLGKAHPGKTGQRSDRRPRGKTGQGGDPRLYCAFFSKTGHPKYL
jgi:hypothetical protein